MLFLKPYLAPGVNYVMFHVGNSGGLPFAKLWRFLACASAKEFCFCAKPCKVNQQSYSLLFIFRGIFIAWYETLHNRAWHALHASATRILLRE